MTGNHNEPRATVSAEAADQATPITNPTIGPEEINSLILAARDLGWTVVPQLLHSGWVNALMRTVGTTTDLVTLPHEGWSKVARTRGGPGPADWRSTGTEVWRYTIPLHLALLWVTSEIEDMAALSDWDSYAWFSAALPPRLGDSPLS